MVRISYVSLMDNNYTYNPDTYWQDTEDSYPHYPTVRHRKRFILSSLRKHCPGGSFSVFDFGCGEGTLLATIQKEFSLQPEQVGGCDISKQAVEGARKKLNSPYLLHEMYPTLTQKFDVMICSEVIEHTTDYENVLRWMAENLNSGGVMIVTTQSGSIHASDIYTGHTQHFILKNLRKMMEGFGLNMLTARLWGWPLFSLQKYLTNIRFDRIQKNYLEGNITLHKKITFSLAYAAYFVHDLIPLGPQIYIVARKA